jgi:hypothetical protein
MTHYECADLLKSTLILILYAPSSAMLLAPEVYCSVHYPDLIQYIPCKL